MLDTVQSMLDTVESMIDSGNDSGCKSLQLCAKKHSVPAPSGEDRPETSSTSSSTKASRANACSHGLQLCQAWSDMAGARELTGT